MFKLLCISYGIFYSYIEIVDSIFFYKKSLFVNKM